MKYYFFLVSFACLAFSFASGQLTQSRKEKVAFPGAEGFGKYTTGGKGGQVLIVENLNDSGPGSLRSAIEADFPRTIVFNISGNIELKSKIKVEHGDLTIAGQSAPGDGICLKNYNFEIKADNVIIRYMRFRMGDEKRQQDDGLSVTRQKNIIIDHCSISWGTDEVATAYDNEAFTMQWCIISESLNKSIHQKGEHGYGGIWGGKGASFHHNLLAHHKSRLPRFCGARYHQVPANEIVDFRNNVIYNWKSNNAYGGEEGNHNIVNNYYRPGPATSSSKKGRILDPYAPFGRFYVAGNILYGEDAITEDNRLGVVAGDPESYLANSPITVVEIPDETAEEAYGRVLDMAGASLIRDLVDARIVLEAKNGTAQYGVRGNGIIDSQSQIGGWPVLQTYDVKADADKDGMPDAWEEAKGLNPKDGDDHALLSLDDHYTNIEIYLNELLDF